MCTGNENPAVEAVRSALTENTFSCGQLEVPSDKLLLFYSKQKGGMEGAARLVHDSKQLLSSNLFFQCFKFC